MYTMYQGQQKSSELVFIEQNVEEPIPQEQTFEAEEKPKEELPIPSKFVNSDHNKIAEVSPEKNLDEI